ncbi:hypothetical protein C8J57DRAFT_1217283 [Mycena rebaudengoi]|nr:hypothetical protein C8J57DRAFT_1217283 [Mycena rebaudengoi]
MLKVDIVLCVWGGASPKRPKAKFPGGGKSRESGWENRMPRRRSPYAKTTEGPCEETDPEQPSRSEAPKSAARARSGEENGPRPHTRKERRKLIIQLGKKCATSAANRRENVGTSTCAWDGGKQGDRVHAETRDGIAESGDNCCKTCMRRRVNLELSVPTYRANTAEYLTPRRGHRRRRMVVLAHKLPDSRVPRPGDMQGKDMLQAPPVGEKTERPTAEFHDDLGCDPRIKQLQGSADAVAVSITKKGLSAEGMEVCEAACEARGTESAQDEHRRRRDGKPRCLGTRGGTRAIWDILQRRGASKKRRGRRNARGVRLADLTGFAAGGRGAEGAGAPVGPARGSSGDLHKRVSVGPRADDGKRGGRVRHAYANSVRHPRTRREHPQPDGHVRDVCRTPASAAQSLRARRERPRKERHVCDVDDRRLGCIGKAPEACKEGARAYRKAPKTCARRARGVKCERDRGRNIGK